MLFNSLQVAQSEQYLFAKHDGFETRFANAAMARDLEAFLKIDVRTIYNYVQRGLIPYVRIESNIRFSKHQVLQWLEERNFCPRLVNGKGGSRQ